MNKADMLQHFATWELDVELDRRAENRGDVRATVKLAAEERADLRWVRGFVAARAEPGTKRLQDALVLLERLGRDPSDEDVKL